MTNITKLLDGHYFVFGSNEAGRHGKGAALCAKQYFGAVYGQAHGEQGSSYALATKDDSLRALSLDTIAENVRVFLLHAKNHPHKQFAVTRVGCGLAGYRDEEIAPMFKDIGSNVYFLEESWKEFM